MPRLHTSLTMTRLQTVVELPEFQRRAKSMMTDDELQSAISFIAANPERGTSLGGGSRKVRIPRTGGEKEADSGCFLNLAGYVFRSFWGRNLPDTKGQA